MNTLTISAECFHGQHSACTFEDCACHCHIGDHLNDEESMTYRRNQDGTFTWIEAGIDQGQELDEHQAEKGPYSPSKFACTICGDLNCTWHA